MGGVRVGRRDHFSALDWELIRPELKSHTSTGRRAVASVCGAIRLQLVGRRPRYVTPETEMYRQPAELDQTAFSAPFALRLDHILKTPKPVL
ncbi:unnamed protein product [Lota lota]